MNRCRIRIGRHPRCSQLRTDELNTPQCQSLLLNTAIMCIFSITLPLNYVLVFVSVSSQDLCFETKTKSRMFRKWTRLRSGPRSWPWDHKTILSSHNFMNSLVDARVTLFITVSLAKWTRASSLASDSLGDIFKKSLFGIWEISAQCDAWFSAQYKYSYLLT